MGVFLIFPILFSACLGAVGIHLFLKNRKIPENLGITNGKFSELPSTANAVSSQTKDKCKKVKALIFKGDLEESVAKIVSALKEYGNIVIVTQTDRYIHGIHKSRWLKFRDDLEFYFDVSKQKIHFRSASRVGSHDMGVNRKRYDMLKSIYCRME